MRSIHNILCVLMQGGFAPPVHGVKMKSVGRRETFHKMLENLDNIYLGCDLTGFSGSDIRKPKPGGPPLFFCVLNSVHLLPFRSHLFMDSGWTSPLGLKATMGPGQPGHRLPNLHWCLF